MNIGYFVTAFPYKNPINGKMVKPYMGGGVEIGTYNLAVQMAKKGHQVFIFTSSINSENSIEVYGNIHIYRYKKSFTIGQCPISFSLLYKPLFSGLDLDIIHARMGNLPAPLTAYLYSLIISKKFIVSYHGDWVGGFGSFVRRAGVFLFNNVICNILLSKADTIITLSKDFGDQSKYLTKYSEKTIYIPNGINLDEFENIPGKIECRHILNLSPDKKVILFVGSLTPIKAPDILLDAFSDVFSKIPNSHLIFIGDGFSKSSLETSAKEKGLEKVIDFAGYIDDNNKKMLYYKSSDIFILPSRSEAFGTVLLEASACELPLIVSDLQSFRAIINEGTNGFFTKTGDSKDLADKILYLLQNEIIRKEMGVNAKKNANNFSWQIVADETESAYYDLINER